MGVTLQFQIHPAFGFFFFLAKQPGKNMQEETEEFLLTAFDSVIAVITQHAVKGNHRIPIQRPASAWRDLPTCLQLPY